MNIIEFTTKRHFLTDTKPKSTNLQKEAKETNSSFGVYITSTNSSSLSSKPSPKQVNNYGARKPVVTRQSARISFIGAKHNFTLCYTRHDRPRPNHVHLILGFLQLPRVFKPDFTPSFFFFIK